MELNASTLGDAIQLAKRLIMWDAAVARSEQKNIIYARSMDSAITVTRGDVFAVIPGTSAPIQCTRGTIYPFWYFSDAVTLEQYTAIIEWAKALQRCVKIAPELPLYAIYLAPQLGELVGKIKIWLDRWQRLMFPSTSQLKQEGDSRVLSASASPTAYNSEIAEEMISRYLIGYIAEGATLNFIRQGNMQVLNADARLGNPLRFRFHDENEGCSVVVKGGRVLLLLH